MSGKDPTGQFPELRETRIITYTSKLVAIFQSLGQRSIETMPDDLTSFLKHLSDSGILTANEINALRDSWPEEADDANRTTDRPQQMREVQNALETIRDKYQYSWAMRTIRATKGTLAALRHSIVGSPERPCRDRSA